MRMRSEAGSSLAVMGMGESAGEVVEVQAARAFVCVVRRRKAPNELGSKMSSIWSVSYEDRMTFLGSVSGACANRLWK